MTVKQIIGITGRVHHGKDTIADILVKERGFVKVPIGTPMYEMVYRMDCQVGGSTVRKIVDSIGWDQAKDWYPEIRRLLIQMGHEARDVISPTIWPDAWWRRARTAGPRIVVQDVRYDSDAHKITQVHGRIWHVVRPGYVNPDEANRDHAGEQGIDPRFILHHFTNDEGQQEQLRLAVLMAADGVG